MACYYDKLTGIMGVDLLRKDEDGNFRSLPQINADMIGWNEIAQITLTAWREVDKKDNCFIFCANYGQADAKRQF